MTFKGVMLSGLPRAGKSTLIKKLEAELHWEVFGAGDLWRARWENWKQESLENDVLYALKVCPSGKSAFGGA